MIPRWVQVPIGLLLGMLTLLCALGAIALVIAPPEAAPVAAPIGGVVMLGITLWVLEKCFRLITGRQNHGGLMSPRTLRAIALLFLLLPVGALIAGGSDGRLGLFTVVQAIASVSVFFGLRRLAGFREASEVTHDIAGETAASPQGGSRPAPL